MKLSKLSQLLLISILLGAMFSLSACSDDDNPLDPPVEEIPLQPATTDSLMILFAGLNTNMALDDLEDILHEDFQFLLSQGLISDWNLAPGSVMDKDQMVRIHSSIFGGIPGSDEHGNNISPIDRIEVSLFEREGIWSDVANNDPTFPGTKQAMYFMRFFFHDNTGGHAFEASQTLIVYAGQVGDYWYLQGIRPIEYKSTENASYDSLLYFYNSVPG